MQGDYYISTKHYEYNNENLIEDFAKILSDIWEKFKLRIIIVSILILFFIILVTTWIVTHKITKLVKNKNKSNKKVNIARISYNKIKNSNSIDYITRGLINRMKNNY